MIYRRTNENVTPETVKAILVDDPINPTEVERVLNEHETVTYVWTNEGLFRYQVGETHVESQRISRIRVHSPNASTFEVHKGQYLVNKGTYCVMADKDYFESNYKPMKNYYIPSWNAGSSKPPQAAVFYGHGVSSQDLVDFFGDTRWAFQEIREYSALPTGNGSNITCVAIYAPDVVEPIRVYKGNYIVKDPEGSASKFGYSQVSKEYFESHYSPVESDVPDPEIDYLPTFAALFHTTGAETNVILQPQQGDNLIEAAWKEFRRQCPEWAHTGHLRKLILIGYREPFKATKERAAATGALLHPSYEGTVDCSRSQGNPTESHAEIGLRTLTNG